MLNYYDDRNKEEDSLLDEQITMEIDSRSGNSGDMYNWKITRRRTKERQGAFPESQISPKLSVPPGRVVLAS